MVKNILQFLFLSLMSFYFLTQNTYSAINPNFTPKWNVGDSWETVIRELSLPVPDDPNYKQVPGKPQQILFEVKDILNIDGEICYLVEIIYKNPTCVYERNSTIQLFVRKEDFTLKKIVELYKREDNTLSKLEFINRNGNDFFIFAKKFDINLTFDFPNFPENNINEERTIKVLNSEQIMTQKVSFINEKTAQVELSTKVSRGIYKTNQIWEIGNPWWSSAKRTFTYKDYQTGKEVTKVEHDPVLEGVDTLPPELSVMISQSDLWPPNHQMVKIDITTEANDNYDRHPDVKLDTIISNEPDDAPGGGDGHTTQDIEIKEDGSIFLRAERSGKGKGRIYKLIYSATDASGNKSTASATVTVPHDKGK